MATHEQRVDRRELNARQVELLRHPARTRILFALPEDGATVSQLAARLTMNKGNVAHHLRVLRGAGLVEPGRTRTVRGGTEQYWLASARRLHSPAGPRGHTGAFLESVAEEIDGSRVVPMLHLRHLRLDPRQARALEEFLDRLVSDLEPGRPSDPTYGVLVSVFGGH